MDIPLASPHAHLPAPVAGGPLAPEAWATGWPGFDALGLVRPGRVLLVDVACGAAHDVLFRLLAGAIAQGREAVVVDGGNWIDPYRLGDAARALGLRRDDVLGAVRLARGFTAHQLQSLVEDALPREAADPRVGLALVSCLPEMYLDDDLHPAEAKALLARALATARRVARERDVPVVVSNSTLAPRSMLALRRVLDAGVDDAVGLFAAPDGGLRVRVGDAVVLAQRPQARQRVLEDYPARAPRAEDEAWFDRPSYDPALRYAPKRAGELRFQQREAGEELRKARQGVLTSAHAPGQPGLGGGGEGDASDPPRAGVGGDGPGRQGDAGRVGERRKREGAGPQRGAGSPEAGDVGGEAQADEGHAGEVEGGGTMALRQGEDAGVVVGERDQADA